jgi:hypothetical protein
MWPLKVIEAHNLAAAVASRYGWSKEEALTVGEALAREKGCAVTEALAEILA